MMAQEAAEASAVSTSSSGGTNWWDVQIAGTAVSSAASNAWSRHMHPWAPPPHHSSNASCDDDISISAASFANHSGLSSDSAAAAGTDLSGEHAENHLWSQVLFTQSDGDQNFLGVLSSKNLNAEMPESACNYLKKLDGSWGFTSSPPFNQLETKQMSAYDGGGSFAGQDKLNNLSVLVNNWSIAPPAQHLAPSTAGRSGSPLSRPPMSRYLDYPLFPHLKHEASPSSPAFTGGETPAGEGISSGLLLPSPGGSQMRRSERAHHDQLGINSDSSLLRPIGGGHHPGGYHVGVPDVSCPNIRSFVDLVSFGGCQNKPSIDFRGSKTSARNLDSADSRKQSHETTDAPSIRGSGSHSSATTEGKKKRSEDNSETQIKKSKHESSSSPSRKLQVPKVKLGERITALQQIVSPFGKTDTASVLMETINYIVFLHEQVQLLSDPYMKSGINKDHGSWVGLERKDKQELNKGAVDLKSRGLCLVPVSCTPQIYRENNQPDYWTPTYRGCLYR